MKEKDFYSEAHLVIAAIRVLEHQKKAPPSIDDVCHALSFSLEQGNLICRKLFDMDIINLVEGAYGPRLFIKNHLKLEEIAKSEKESTLGEELKKFQEKRKSITQKIESIQVEQSEKKKDLFAKLEAQLKKKSNKK